MSKNLLNNDALNYSSIVANSQMNRQRRCVGSNSYTRELRVNPVKFLTQRFTTSPDIAWLDLCCGSGNALLEAARIFKAQYAECNVQITGIDLVGMFTEYTDDLPQLVLKVAALPDWQPDRQFDLITCVHGLHYIGDKLKVIQQAASWLAQDGLFVANLDATSFRLPDGKSAGRQILRQLRNNGFTYDAARHLLQRCGRQVCELNYRYLGADDYAGPNYTGQPAIHSYYSPPA